MEAIIKDLNSLKDDIESSKRKLSQLEGRKEEMMKRLKADFGLSSLSEAQKKIDKDDSQLSKLKAEIEKKYNELKENFEWE